MIKLSRAGWNNVIIFAVLGFILLINATQDNVFSVRSSGSDQVSLLGEHAAILTLTVNQQIKIERIGKTWRAQPSNIQGQALEQMMSAWQQSIATHTDAPQGLDNQLALIVSIEIAGQPSATVLHIHIIDDTLVIFNQHSQRWLVLPIQLYSQLLPDQLFSSQ